ncbi:sensor histidine kinase [Solihabitans fulvus]|uniref:sensor histidine kinase n=1 Tax=Solihabitans fulvus TaxID=1892852 RepID=UPI001CB75D62|nr:nitrate- and nitrite sensing domain-containing protein [Solihabitans fulvus]
MRGQDDDVASPPGPARAAAQDVVEPESRRADRTPESTEAGVSTRGRWRLRNWRLRSKLVVVLLVPALSTLALAGLRLSSQLDDVGLFGQVQQELQLNGQVEFVADALQLERDAMVSYVAGGRGGNAATQATQSKQVDIEVGKLRGMVDSTQGVDPAVRDALAKSIQALSGLPALRNSALSTSYPDKAALTAYTQILGVLGQVNRATATSLSNPAITPLAAASQALNIAKEQLAEQNAILISAAKHDAFPAGQATELRAAQSRFDAALADFTNVASIDNRQRYQDTVSGADVDERNRLAQLALVQSDMGQKVTLSDADVTRLGENSTALVRKVTLNIDDQTAAAVTTLTDDARRAALRDAALVAVALLVAFGLMAIVARSMLTPLRVLRKTALDVARHRLPEAIKRIRTDRDPVQAARDAIEPVPVHTTEEVGQVARAFDVVHQEAVRLAVEQAALRANVNDMFVNLSRRSQALVERQIGVIDKLEQDEQDPDHLASLFELDHLATQMRRNSENLLVLSGTTVARRVTKPAQISEVIGAAVSEVEKYARVQVAATPEILVQGRVVNDLAHLIAELLDNATAFSPPSTKVTVRTIETRHGEVAIRIHDRGVGMQNEDVVAANERLAEPPEVDVSISREMGLYVVAQLAKRHAIKVVLSNNDDIDGGTTAQVTLPAGLLHQRSAKQSTPAVGTTDINVARAFGSTRAKPERAIASLAETQAQALVDTSAWTPSAPAALPTPVRIPVEPEVYQRQEASGIDLFEPPPALSAEQGRPEEYMPPPLIPSRPIAEPVAEPTEDPNAAGPATVRLPVYESVLSRWFQTTIDAEDAEAAAQSAAPVEPRLAATAPAAPERPIPERTAPERTAPERQVPERPISERTVSERPVRAPEPRREPAPLAARAEPKPTAAALPKRPERSAAQAKPLPAAEPAAVTRRRPPPPVPAAAASLWGSPADEGWKAAAEALNAPTPEAVTGTGLPKRVPKAHLVPGSAQTAAPQAGRPPSVPRSAERLRERFATYQRGVRLGRDTRGDADDDYTYYPTTVRGNEEQE